MAILLALFLQADGLVEKLRSESIEEREEASRKLKELGPAAAPALEKAAKDADGEMAARARGLLRSIEIRSKLSPGFLRAFPRADERLVSEGDEAWAEIFVEASGRDSEALRYPHVTREDLSFLAPRALRAGGEALDAVCREIGFRRLGSAAPALRERLKPEAPAATAQAVVALGLLQDRESAPLLMSLWATGDWQIIETTVWALGAMVPRERAGDFVRMSRDPEAAVRAAAIRVLAEVSPKEALPRVRELLKDEKNEVREAALRAAVDLGFPPAELVPFLQDPFVPVGTHVLRYLARTDHPRATTELRKALEGEFMGIRREAVLGLRWRGVKESAGEIARRLMDESPEVRRAAARTLGTWGVETEALRPLLKEEDPLVRWEAARGLFASKAAGGREAVEEFLASTDPWKRGDAIAVLVRAGARECVPAMRKMLGDGATNVRSWAAEAMGTLGVKEAVPELRKLLADEDPWVIWSAASALATLGVREAAGEIAAAGSKRQWACEGAVEALLKLGRDEKGPEIAKLLEDASPAIRAAAARALARSGRRWATPVLLRDSWKFFELNRLRRPAVWERLAKPRPRPDLSGNQIQMIRDWEHLLGMKFEGVRSIAPATGTLYENEGGEVGVLEDVRGLCDEGTDLILEEDRILFLPRDEALAFWTKWWRDEGGK